MTFRTCIFPGTGFICKVNSHWLFLMYTEMQNACVLTIIYEQSDIIRLSPPLLLILTSVHRGMNMQHFNAFLLVCILLLWP